MPTLTLSKKNIEMILEALEYYNDIVFYQEKNDRINKIMIQLKGILDHE